MKTCSHCNIAKSLGEFTRRSEAADGLSYTCRSCNHARSIAWKKANPEKVAAEQRRHRDRVLADQARHDARKASLRARKAEHRDEVNASHRAWLAANPERYAEYKRKQHEAYVPTVRKPGKGRDPEKLHAAKKRRKALERGAPLSDLTAAQWAAIKEAYDLRCAYCGERVEVLTQDHVLALSKGGAHTATNIVPACKSCNSRKNDRPAPVMQMRLIGS